MGLDSVELVIRTEEQFCIEIPDQEAERIFTPRMLASFVATRVTLVPASECLAQHAFYTLRRALRDLGLATTVAPGTCLDDVLPEIERSGCWNELGRRLGTRPWPKLRRRRLFAERTLLPKGCETAGELALHLATWGRSVPTTPSGPWTKETVLLRVRQIVSEQLGIDAFSSDAHFIKDLGVN